MRQWLLLAWLLSFPLAAANAPAPAAPVQEQSVVGHLNEAIGWYRRLSAQAQLATEPSDVMFINQDVVLARQAVGQAFEGSRGLAALAGTRATSGDAQAPRAKRAAEAADAVQKRQAEVDALQKELATARPADREALAQQLEETRSELALAQASAQALKTMLDFSAQVGTGSAGLTGQIDELERSVPEIHAQQPANLSSADAVRSARQPGQGVIGLTEELFRIARKQREIQESLAQTAALRAVTQKLSAPLGAEMKTTLQQGDQLSNAPDSSDPAVSADRKRQLDALTAQFKKLSAALLPLGKEAVLLDAVRANLAQWDAANDSASAVVLRSLAVRAALLVAIIALLLAGSGLWRRATLRYVQDPRRRQVSLLVRRIVVTAAVSMAVVFSLASELGSLATFAGFITAGLAVALQNIILSMAAYFFLIGKYGLRVGERVQIGAVVGDVLEIGLVRLHVMETGADGLPTGRVVVFSNSVVFSGPNLFKPLPGTSFAWHQIKLTLAAGADRHLAEQNVLRAVQEVVDEYLASIDRQHAELSQAVSIPLQAPRPECRLRLTEAGLEMLVRYPVPLAEAAAVDDKVTRALLDAIEHEPRLELAGSAGATVQPSQ